MAFNFTQNHAYTGWNTTVNLSFTDLHPELEYLPEDMSFSYKPSFGNTDEVIIPGEKAAKAYSDMLQPANWNLFLAAYDPGTVTHRYIVLKVGGNTIV
ncbi:MAG: hypothetical protein GX148_04115 [Clostridiales bacterium]|nr:hypothetical protein [Clostridiales bacterium]